MLSHLSITKFIWLHYYFSKPEKNKEKEVRTYEVCTLHESEIEGFMKTCIDKWIDACKG